MFNYRICNVFDKNIFAKQCSALEKHIPDLQKKSFSEDVDGSQIQVYMFSNGKNLKVINNKVFGVDIESEVDIDKYFS